MTREEAIECNKNLRMYMKLTDKNQPCKFLEENYIALDMAIKALEQESRKDEVILTKEEYGELVSSEFDNGYDKGYAEALEQNDVLDKIRAEIEHLAYYWCEVNPRTVIDDVLQIIDKYRAESEVKE